MGVCTQNQSKKYLGWTQLFIIELAFSSSVKQVWGLWLVDQLDQPIRGLVSNWIADDATPNVAKICWESNNNRFDSWPIWNSRTQNPSFGCLNRKTWSKPDPSLPILK